MCGLLYQVRIKLPLCGLHCHVKIKFQLCGLHYLKDKIPQDLSMYLRLLQRPLQRLALDQYSNALMKGFLLMRLIAENTIGALTPRARE